MSVPEKLLSHFRKAASSKEKFAKIEAQIRNYPDFETAFIGLAGGIDDSVFPIEEWVEAFAAFFCNISKESIPDLQSVAGYITCCAESQVKYPVRPSLADVVREMLQEYGFDGR
ncbi:MAG: hypothetical protein HOD72_09980 [Opitutae bacterium]|jgi:hypothetical protein|nr:hypothetical protein [Opitutae bacterium]MBT4224779.1 hypothetical protein [Opitutae bacterium]MBT5377607.1 hypothetical protein [Opitutae bacterium]MBT5692729.1 hypothetical protein [Opitutae bacterium]MBT6461408.1 hypothetical protein [Opitutae bacterium]